MIQCADVDARHLMACVHPASTFESNFKVCLSDVCLPRFNSTGAQSSMLRK